MGKMAGIFRNKFANSEIGQVIRSVSSGLSVNSAIRGHGLIIFVKFSVIEARSDVDSAGDVRKKTTRVGILKDPLLCSPFYADKAVFTMSLAFASSLTRALPISSPRGAFVCIRPVAKPAYRTNRRASTRWICATASSAAQAARDAIASSPIMVFSGSYCPYCVRVKGLFNELGVEHNVWEVDLRSDGQEIRRFLAEETGQTTVPNVFIGGKHVGGCDGR